MFSARLSKYLHVLFTSSSQFRKTFMHRTVKPTEVDNPSMSCLKCPDQPDVGRSTQPLNLLMLQSWGLQSSPAPTRLYLVLKLFHRLIEPGTRYCLRTYSAGIPSEMSWGKNVSTIWKIEKQPTYSTWASVLGSNPVELFWVVAYPTEPRRCRPATNSAVKW